MTTQPFVKINLGLNVLKKREDGFHDIETLFLPYREIHDTLEIIPADAYSQTLVRLSGLYSIEQGTLVQAISDDAKVMVTIAREEGVDWEPLKDLTVKAYRLLDEDFSLPAVKIFLEKTAPVGAGLGGGSSDAAAVLTALDSYFGTGLDLVALGAEVSSDVPFFASGYRFAHVTGRGEQVEESPGPERMPVILAVPEHKVPTGYAFSVLDAIKRDRTPLPPLTRDIPDKKDFPNDFELIEENACPFIKADGFASLSGSGAVWYLISELFQDEWLEIRGYCVKYKTEFI